MKSGHKMINPQNLQRKSFPPFPLSDTKENAQFDNVMLNTVNLLKGRKNIVVVVGAGISTSAGIPDFRSKGGIYDEVNNSLDYNELGLSTPEELFHMEIFQEDPRPFYSFAKSSLYASSPDFTPSHKFLALLDKMQMLRRIYTQNIDGLEVKAGISPNKVVYAHGSLSTSTCLRCKNKVDTDSIRNEILSGNVPTCKARLSKKRKKQDNDSDSIGLICHGVMKPNITFFGEKLNDKVRRCLESDRSKADALIVIGTSLSVSPMNKVIQYLRPSIPRILINRNIVIPKNMTIDDDSLNDANEKDHRTGYIFDAILLGFCDEITRAFAYIMQNQQDETRNEKLHSNLNNETTPKTERAIKPASGKTSARLLPFHSDECVLLSETKLENLDQKSLHNHPVERIILFPGAKLDVPVDNEDTIYHEVVNCDGCHKVIKGDIMRCTTCFDFDLCSMCHSKLSKTHFDGSHKFLVEKQSKSVDSKL